MIDMENEITYIPMEDDFREEIKRRYTKPRNIHMTLLTIVFFGFYLMFLLGIDRSWEHPLWTIAAVTVGFMFKSVLIYLLVMFFFLQYKICYLKDANLGAIAKERMQIVKAEHTPAGISIYWLDSDDVMTFIPEPQRFFNAGDMVTIYYLKFSKEYLSYEA